MTTSQLDSEQISEMLQGISIPPQPQILVDIQIEQASPEPSLKRIADLVAHDPGLSGTMLKVVNSPFFGLKKTVTSIPAAVSMLGLNTVVNILGGISIRGALSDEHIVALGNFWDTAFHIAHVSTAIAERLRLRTVEETYVLGLFHNCGIPLLMQRFPTYMDTVRQSYAQSKEPITDFENNLLSTNHAVIGYYVARSWNLPRHLCEVIHQHHHAHLVLQSKDLSSVRKKPLMATLKMAEHICSNHLHLGQQRVDHEWEALKPQVLAALDLLENEYEDLCEYLQEITES